MAFNVGNKVWFKRAGSTPFVDGDASDAGTTFDHQLVGRNKAAISFSAEGMIRQEGGVPQIFATDLATPLTTQDGSVGTFNASGAAQGVVEQTVANPLAPKTVTIPGMFAAPSDKALFNTGTDVGGSVIDEGATDRNGINTINTIDPNFATGRPHAAVAEGPAVAISGNHEFAPEVIDIKSASKRLGVRVPSDQLEAGVVIAVVNNVTVGTVSPDGTRISAGRMYHVNWGPINPSDPHHVKWFNRQRALTHAEEDLIAA